ncbi:MAG TPA: CaiB/BaiF CoA-transferase family protein [Trebonia sp.]|nr:CaiB/BaiF CoA-transferase family protein [Trebonia sp.]
MSSAVSGEGPALLGIRVVCLAAPGPIPQATMLMSDLGADVIRIDRADGPPGLTGLPLDSDPRTRGQRGIAVDLKCASGLEIARLLAAGADVFVEGMRPGVAERLGLGPDELRGNHAGLIYARMTGWGQDGPMSQRAGHDINYLSIAGALHPLGPADREPVAPLNLVADFGGGGLYLVTGVLAALVQRARTGNGQVIDAAMVDGVASLTSMFHGMLAAGVWSTERESNIFDGAAPFYRTYRTADGQFMAVGALEPQFYRQLLTGLGLEAGEWPQHDRSRWPELTKVIAGVFATAGRDYWAESFSGTDACVTPVLSLSEAAAAESLAARSVFIERDGLVQPAPAPRLSDSPPQVGRRSGWGSHTDAVLAELGYSQAQIGRLRGDGVVSGPDPVVRA